MKLVEFGKGPPLVLISGIQGRWEYVRPAIDALASSFRVVAFPLCGEPDSGRAIDPRLGYENDSRIVLDIIDRLDIARAIVCGISFGGLPAIHVAATHPERVMSLVLVSTPAPRWQLRPRHEIYARMPWLFGPLFFAETPFRVYPEIAAALPSLAARWRFVRWQLRTLVRAPLSPKRMAARAALMTGSDIVSDCARVRADTLVVTGERGLDRVVAVDGTLEYLRLIDGSRHTTLERTGHLGTITHPQQFAAIVTSFAASPGARSQTGNPDAA